MTTVDARALVLACVALPGCHLTHGPGVHTIHGGGVPHAVTAPIASGSPATVRLTYVCGYERTIALGGRDGRGTVVVEWPAEVWLPGLSQSWVSEEGPDRPELDLEGVARAFLAEPAMRIRWSTLAGALDPSSIDPSTVDVYAVITHRPGGTLPLDGLYRLRRAPYADGSWWDYLFHDCDAPSGAWLPHIEIDGP